MPDWSYQPLLRPLLFCLPAARARDVALGALGALSALPGGLRVIDFMGHMTPPPGSARTLWGITFPGAVGLGAGFDHHARALPALARFGFGFLEVGPVTDHPVTATQPVERVPAQEALRYPAAPVNDGLAALVARLAAQSRRAVPLGVRLAHQPGATVAAATEERVRLIAALAPYAAFFTLDYSAESAGWGPPTWRAHLTALGAALRQADSPAPLLLCVPPDSDPARVAALLPLAVECGVRGVLVAGGIAAPDGSRLLGRPTQGRSLALVRAIHAAWGERLPIIAAGGVLEPADALRLLAAGASLVQVHSGLVYSGPGLPKRINETLAYYAPPNPAPATPAGRGGIPAWVWMLLLGLGMIVGGTLVGAVAATWVVLPYDEAFVGLTRTGLAEINARVLPFLTHVRVTLAGTLVAIGILYTGLALYGLRQGVHWAQQTVRVSALVGFASFFLFLGFGYFDPLHAVLSIMLFPFFLLGLRAPAAGPPVLAQPDLHNDWAWQAGMKGQLLFVALGAGLVLAGVTIAAVGISSVLVPDDQVFLQTPAATLQAANPHLLPLVAHDRAGFGGALLANGLAVLLISLWGFRRGARAVWWILLLGGVTGFSGAVGVHLAVGYLEITHLGPALIALALFLAGALLSYPYLCGTTAQPSAPQVRRLLARR
jgi:dihydroorotate dehydrogenase